MSKQLPPARILTERMGSIVDLVRGDGLFNWAPIGVSQDLCRRLGGNQNYPLAWWIDYGHADRARTSSRRMFGRVPVFRYAFKQDIETDELSFILKVRLQPGDGGSLWYGEECPLCGGEHWHGAGLTGMNPRRWLSHRCGHCPGDRMGGYILVEAPKPRSVASKAA